MTPEARAVLAPEAVSVAGLRLSEPNLRSTPDLTTFYSEEETPDLTSFYALRPRGWKRSGEPARPRGWPEPQSPGNPQEEVRIRSRQPPCATGDMVAPAPETNMPKFLPKIFLFYVMALISGLMLLIYACVPWDDDTPEEEIPPELMGKSGSMKTKSDGAGATGSSSLHTSSTASSGGLKRSTSTRTYSGSRHGKGSVREGHKTPWEQYFALAFWLLLLLNGVAFTRIVCQHGIPADCQENTNTVAFAKMLHETLLHGLILAVFTGMINEARFMYVFSYKWKLDGMWVIPRAFVFLTVFFATMPIYGYLSDIPWLTTFSLRSDSTFDVLHSALLLALQGLIVFLLVWHVWFAYHFSKGFAEGFWAYILSRVFWLGLYAAYFVLASDMSGQVFHLHHYVVGFLLAILAEFNEPLSLILLAIGSGIMVQGIAAYGADPLTHPKGFKGF